MMTLSSLLVIAVSAFLLRCTQAQNNGDIRLVSNQSQPIRYQGRLEIFMNSEWGTICAVNSPHLQAVTDTACRQLGFKNAYAWDTVTGLDYPVAPASTPIHIGSINCPPSDDDCSKDYLQHVLRCAVDETVDQKLCTHETDIAVYCVPESLLSPSYESQIRLYAIAPYEPPINISLSSGIVGIFFNRPSKPGLICGTGLDQNIANTACRQLGYTNAVSFNASLHTSKQTVWDTGLICKSQSHNCLNSCFGKTPTNQTTCDSIVAVSCEFQLSLKSGSPPGSPLQCDTADRCNNAHPTNSPNTGSPRPNTDSSPVGLIVAVVVVVGLAIGFTICITLLLCCIVPGCLLHSKRSTGGYQPVTS